MRAVVVAVALIALVAVAFYAVQFLPPHIEADLKQRASAALVAANLQFATVAVTGRVVTLSGEAPGLVAKDDAIKIVQNVWGVASVNDALVVALVVGEAAAQPLTPQTVIDAAPQAPALAPAPAQTPPAAEPPPTALPTVESAIDPALAPPEPEPPETVAAPPEPPAPAPASAPPPQETQSAAAQFSSAPAAPPAPPPAAPSIPAMIAKGSATGLAASAQMAVSPPPAAPPSYRLEAHVEGRRVELQGLVSTPSAARALVAQVRRNVYRAQIVDTLKVAHNKPDRDWLGVARTGLSQLAHLDTGSLRLDGHSVAMSGRPRSESDRARVLAALNGLPAGYTSTVLLERMPEAAAPPPAVTAAAPAAIAPPPTVAVHPTAAQRPSRLAATRYRASARPVVARSLSADCRRRFGDVLPRVAVAFDSGSSRLRSNAVSGLDELAHVARACPQARIGLTGHSDTQEAPAAALQLSRSRAYAVRAALEERGVAGASIGVAGRGGLRPAFSNATAEGRDNNRRVEFAVW